MKSKSLTTYLPIVVLMACLQTKEDNSKDQRQAADFDPSKAGSTETAMDISLSGKALHAVKLAPFVLHDGQATAGQFQHYYIAVQQPKEFTITLTLYSGEAELYITKDTQELPSEAHYWKKSETSKGDELLITPEMFDIADEIVRGYYVGVRGKSSSQFSLLFLPEFDNLINMRFQKLVDLNIVKGKAYYFDFYNSHDQYSTYLYAEETDIEVSALDYDLHKHEDFLSMVANESNYLQKFVFKMGDLPRLRFYDHPATVNKHIIIRIVALNKDGRVNFMIYDSKLPIELPAEKRVSFTQDKQQTSTFHFRLDAQYEEVDLDVKLDFGSISINYSDNLASFQSSATISVPTQKYFTYKITKSQEQSNDILIFNDFYLLVASSEFSKFSVLVKPKDRFKALKAFEPEIIFTDPEKDTYVYYHLSPKQRRSIYSLIIDFNSVHYYGQNPELLFSAESDVVLDSSSPFLPMPLIDISHRDTGEFRQIEIRPDIQPGYYVLKIEKFGTRLPIKVTVSINNQRSIQPNGFYRGSIPLNKPGSHIYTMYIPQPGEFRLVLESCSKVKIESAEFYSMHPAAAEEAVHDANQYEFHATNNMTSIKFDDHFLQGYQFLYVNETVRPYREVLKNLTYPVKRGYAHEKGILKFKVVPVDGPFLTMRRPEEFYALMTEFRPFDRQTILKDYVKIFDASEDFSGKQFQWRYTDNFEKLSIVAKLPKFSPQIQGDYPRLSKAVVKLYFYLIGDPAIKSKVETCGMSCLHSVPHQKRLVIREVPQEYLVSGYYEDNVEFYFWKWELESFRNATHLHVLCFMSVSFFENDDDLYNVSLDFKFALMPYFLLTIPNIKQPWLSAHYGVILGMSIIVLFLIFAYRKMSHAPPASPEHQFRRPEDPAMGLGGTKLEMSNTTVVTDASF